MPVDSFNETEQLALLAVLLIGLVAILTLLAYVFVLVIDCLSRRKPWKGTVLRVIAGLAMCAAIAVYAWGALHLTADESGAYDRCHAAIPSAYASKAFAYDVSFIPLRGECRVDGVGSFDVKDVSGNFGAPIPEYVNPTVTVAALLAIVSFVTARRFNGDGSSGHEGRASVTG